MDGGSAIILPATIGVAAVGADVLEAVLASRAVLAEFSAVFVAAKVVWILLCPIKLVSELYGTLFTELLHIAEVIRSQRGIGGPGL